MAAETRWASFRVNIGEEFHEMNRRLGSELRIKLILFKHNNKETTIG
jgi:hypothetical protein